MSDDASIPNNNIINTLDSIISNNRNELAAISLREDELYKVYSLINQTKTIISQDSKSLLIQYFNNTKNVINLIPYMHTLYELSLFYENDFYFKKAQEIQLFTKHVIENYIQTLTRVPFNFASLNEKEILSELQIVPNLPEVYTKIIFGLGNSYMALGDLDKSIYYFKLSEYLGYELGLIQGPLSKFNGINKIKQHKIFLDIKNGVNISASKDGLFDLIALYQQRKLDNQKYISYNPLREPIFIQQNTDPIDILYSAEDICQCYMMLYFIEENKKKKKIH